jgi:hypothetical protein
MLKRTANVMVEFLNERGKLQAEIVESDEGEEKERKERGRLTRIKRAGQRGVW